MENFGKFMTVLIMLVLSPIINGFVFFKMWAWFIVPTFHIQPIRLIEAIGIILTINFIIIKYDESVEKEKNDSIVLGTAKRFFTAILMGMLTLFFGWIVTLFM